MVDLNHQEHYEYLETRHRKSRAIDVISLIIIILIGFSNQLFDFKFIYQMNSENYLILAIGVVFTIHVIRTWNGSNELKFLRELFR